MTKHSSPPLGEQELLRYSRQILLPEFDVAGQQRLRTAHVVIIGAGGLGCPAAIYLAAAGVGHLTLIDHDQVELSNLQRQIAHHSTDLGQPKALSAQRTLQALNPNIQVDAHQAHATPALLKPLANTADLLLDATDNYPTRCIINDASLSTKTPLISAAAIRWEAQLTVFDPRHPKSPCYRCLYPTDPNTPESCSESGIIAPLTGILGSLQALEALKLLSNTGQPLHGTLLLYDALQTQWRRLQLPRDPACSACASSS